ncbi:hypothetical protein ACHWQZ_G001781 [Mnemiopsis leidyi]
MDVDELLLLYLPYCVFKKLIICLDEALLKHPEFLSQFKCDQTGLVSPGTKLFDKLAEKNWTCYQLKAEFDSYGDPQLAESFKKCLSVIDESSQNREQNLISQNMALQHQVDELGLQLRLQEQQLQQIDHIDHPMPFAVRSNAYRSVSPINCSEENEEDIEFG